MKIWLVKIGEGARGGRPYRIDMLAEALQQRGHDVLLWTSTFDHMEKYHLFDSDTTKELNARFGAVYMRSPGYTRNVSLRRLWDHRVIAHRYRTMVRDERQKPDLIFCCLPTIGLCKESVAFGVDSRVPVVLDVRDPWPDVYFSVVPEWGRAFAQRIFRPLSDRTNTILAGAAGITAVSEEYLQWGLKRAGREHGTNDGVFPLSYTPPENRDEDSGAICRHLSEIGIDFSKRLCVFVGTLGKSYDIETILKCSSALAQEPRYADVSVVICGDGDKRHLLTEHELPTNLVYAGWLTQPQLRVLTERAQVGFLSYTRSALQSLPNKVFEYMANGVAIISSLEREARSLIDGCECGLSYRSEDVGSMTAAVMALLDDEARCRRYGENGRRAYENEFRPEAIYAKMSEHLENVAASNAAEKVRNHD